MGRFPFNEARQQDENERMRRRRKRNNMIDNTFQLQLVLNQHVATRLPKGGHLGTGSFSFDGGKLVKGGGVSHSHISLGRGPNDAGE
jgi:hypothetical protein